MPRRLAIRRAVAGLAAGAGVATARRRLVAQGASPVGSPGGVGAVVGNDVHSRLNASRVDRVVRPDYVEAVRDVILDAGREGWGIGIAGGRHAMGGSGSGRRPSSSRRAGWTG